MKKTILLCICAYFVCNGLLSNSSLTEGISLLTQHKIVDVSLDEDAISKLEVSCYILIVTDKASGCKKDPTICIKDLTSTKEESWANLGIQLYPNPAKDRISIDFNQAKAINYKIFLIDYQGKQIFTTIRKTHEDHVEIASNAFLPGSYILVINYGNRSYINKIEIVR